MREPKEMGRPSPLIIACRPGCAASLIRWAIFTISSLSLDEIMSAGLLEENIVGESLAEAFYPLHIGKGACHSDLKFDLVKCELLHR